MQLRKHTVIYSFLLGIIVSLTACEKEDRVSEYVKTSIPMTSAQETPGYPSTALGSLDVSYSKKTKILIYKFTWSGLTDTITGIHIHGLAPVSYAAAIVQPILTTKNEAAFPFRGGSYSGNLFADGVKVKEEDILNGFYYLNIHTKGLIPGYNLQPPFDTTYAAGEIRGQIKFQ